MSRVMFAWLSVVFVLVLVQAGSAASLFSGQARPALIDARTPPSELGQARASLFVDREGSSLFKPVVRHVSPPENWLYEGVHRPGVAGLRDLIAKAEAGAKGYDAVVWSARIKPPKPPSQMTISEIYRWIENTPRQNHAIGRYQFIPKTLRRVVQVADVPSSARFSPEVQDRLAHVLLQDAGLNQFMAGGMSKTAFMNNLAKIWAGLPNSTGKSHYHGYAGNKATMSWARFQTAMARIFPG